MEKKPDEGYEFSDKASLRTIIAELSEMSVDPTNGDIRISAFAQAVQAMLMDPHDSRMRLSVEFMLDMRRDADSDTTGGKKEEPFTAQYAVNLLLRSFQHTFLFKRAYPILFNETADEFLNYPEDFDTPEAWLEEAGGILDNPNSHAILDYDLTQRRIQSNIADRYKGPKLAILKEYPSRFRGPLNILDVGASLNLGLTKLVVGDKFGQVEILDSSSRDAFVHDTNATEYINHLINSPLDVAGGVGVDILPGWDLNSREWIRSCSFYPSELLDLNRIEEFDRLVLANSILDKHNRTKSGLNISGVNMDRLSFYIGDFADRNSMRDFSHSPEAEAKFDVVTFITVMHQLSDMERTAMIDRAKNYLKPDGLIIVQDFMEINPDAPNGMDFPNHWYPFLYRTAVIDPLESTSTPRDIVVWDYGRCKQAILV
jgi:hypothetical protein